jgi:L-lactate utilization protein LutB
MAHKFELSSETQVKVKEVQAALEDLKETLEEETQQHRDAYGERSEKWQEGDKGQATETWIEALDELVEGVESLAENLENYEPEPEG